MILPIVAFALQVAAGAPVIGVGTTEPDGRICVAMSGAAIAPGSRITLVQPDKPQTVVSATIERTTPSCDWLERSLVDGPYYTVVARGAPASDRHRIWVALKGAVTSRRLGRDAVTIRLNATHGRAQVRSCTSREGVHLTVWSGTPLTSLRLWHAYFYLGYDVEPSCDPKETAG